MPAEMLQKRDGIEYLDSDVEELDEEADAVHFKTDEAVKLAVDETVGNDVYVEAEYFIAASIDKEIEDEMQQMMAGAERVNESSVFISNEDGELGGGFIRVDEGDLEDAVGEFENEHL